MKNRCFTHGFFRAGLCSLVLACATSVAGGQLISVRLGIGELEVYAIDADTGASTFLDSFLFSGVWNDGMFAADAASGRLYIAIDPPGTVPADLYTIDIATGGLLSVQPLGGAAPERIDAMRVLSDGSLLALQTGVGVLNTFLVDPDTAVATAFPVPGFAFTGGWNQGMFAVDEPGGFFYIATDPSGSVPADLYTIDLTTGGLQSVQPLGGSAPERIDVMTALSDGSILGLDLGIGAFDSYSINPLTAAATPLATPGFSITGGWNSGMFAIHEPTDRFFVTTTALNLYTLSISTGAMQATPAITGQPRVDAMAYLPPDCNTNGVDDTFDLAQGTSSDCNSNGVPDECDIAGATSEDCDANAVPDECDIDAGRSEDCNSNGVPDGCDITGSTSADCNSNGVPDECDIAGSTSTDCDLNDIPDECDTAGGSSFDCNFNGSPDNCDIAGGTSGDCNGNDVPDECDIDAGTSFDCGPNGVPDECDPDCNTNAVPDDCDINAGTSKDCNLNTVPDSCDLAGGASDDCNCNLVPDDCENTAIPPELTCPADVTIACDEPLPEIESNGVFDLCGPVELVDVFDTTDGQSCPETVSRNYVGTNRCIGQPRGSNPQCIQTITIVDDQPPQFDCPADTTIECDASIDPEDTGKPVESYRLGGPGFEFQEDDEFAWAAFDVSGPLREAIESDDNFGPAGTVPRKILTSDLDSIDAAALAQIDGFIALHWLDDNTPDAAAQAIVDFFLAGGDLILVQNSDETDKIGELLGLPVIGPADGSPSTDGAPLFDGPFGVAVEAIHGRECGMLDESTVISSNGAVAARNAIDEVIAAVWNAGEFAPNAGRLLIVADIIAWTDEADYGPAPANDNAIFAMNGVAFIVAVQLDNCDPDPTISFADVNSTGVCPGAPVIHRTWTGTDACNNSAACEQVITTQDTTAPVITCPADAIVNCDESTGPAQVGSATATDNCDPGDVAITSTDSVTPGACPQEYTITRTWTATDACSNSVSCEQTITVVDDASPVITCPGDVTLECDQSTDVASTGFASAIDGCDTNALLITASDSVEPGVCPHGESVITRTFTATDACSNSVSCDQVITVVDTTPPQVTVNSTTTGLLAVDGTCAATIGFSTMAVDNCNIELIPHTLDVPDNVVLAGTPSVSIGPGSVTEAQSSIEVLISQLLPPTPFQLNCQSTISYTVEAFDCNSNAAEPVTVTVDVVDITPPDITCPGDVTVECDESTDPSNTGTAVATDNCSTVGLPVTSSDSVTPGACPQGSTIAREWSATDACGNTSSCTQVITIVDTTAPVITCPADATVSCDQSTSAASIGFATATDNCDTSGLAVEFYDVTTSGLCPQEAEIERIWTATDACSNSVSCTQRISVVDDDAPVITCPADRVVECDAPTDASTTGMATAVDNCDTAGLPISMGDSVAPGACPQGMIITRTWSVIDACGKQSACDQTIEVVDMTPPDITCPDDLAVRRDNPDFQSLVDDWLAGAAATDNCATTGIEITHDADSNAVPCGTFPCDGVSLVTWTAIDPCGNTNSCSASIIVETTEPGWNWVDVGITLTANEPTYWSVASGEPKGVPPLSILDPGYPPGRPATDGTNDRVLRGYIVAWATDPAGEEIRWNHLKGDAVIVNYDKGAAWEYTAYAFQAVDPAVGNGAPTDATPYELHLDGVEYDNGYDLLLLDFYAYGSRPFSLNSTSSVDTDLTLLPLSVDLRQETDGPVTTKASFTIWNQNEIKFTGLDRCITCWDQTLISQYNSPNHFLRANLQTDKGKAQIDGLASQLCNLDYDQGDACTQTFGGPAPSCDPRDRLSSAASLLGLAAKQIAFSATGPYDYAGMHLIGMGTQAATILADPTGGVPPERPDGAVGSVEKFPIDRSVELRPAPIDGSGSGQPVALAASDRTSSSEKGSLLIYPKVELRWDTSGSALIQDTFIDLTNDYPGAVNVQMYFVNGDPPLDATP